MAWLARIVENTVRDAWRSLKRRPVGVTSEPERLEADAGMPGFCRLRPTPSQVTMGQELADRYISALQELPAEQCEAILLRKHIGLSYGEIARQLGLKSEAYGRALVSRGLARVSAKLEHF